MRTRTRLVLLGALGTLGFGVGCAGVKEAGRDVRAATPLVDATNVGIITGQQGNAIAVRPADPNARAAWYRIGPDTEIVRGGQRISLQDLNEGTPVRVDYEPDTGAERTFKVEVLTGAKAQEVMSKVQYQQSNGSMDEMPPPPQNNP